MIEPYNLTLNEMTAAKRRAWGEKVTAELRRHYEEGDQVVLLAGQRYHEQVIPALRQWACRVEVPLEGLGIGQQKAWLKRELARLAGCDRHGRPGAPRLQPVLHRRQIVPLPDAPHARRETVTPRLDTSCRPIPRRRAPGAVRGPDGAGADARGDRRGLGGRRHRGLAARRARHRRRERRRGDLTTRDNRTH